MPNQFTRRASLALVFGLFFITSCSSLSNTESNQTNSEESGPLSEIENINKLLEQDGQNRSLLLRKTELFIEAAKNEPNPSLREPFYTNARNTSIDGTRTFSDDSDQFKQLLTEAWSEEHNSGVRLLQEHNNEGRENRTLDRAIHHLENAIIIQPESLSSYNVLSTAYYGSGRYSDAEKTLQKLLEITSDTEIQLPAKEKLAFIYLESGEREKAVQQYEQLQKENQSSITIQHGLINAYILNNQPEKATDQLKKLTEDYPDRVSYLESLASVRYQLVEIAANSLLTNPNSQSNVSTDIENLVLHLNEIQSIYNNLSENSLMNEESIYNAAGYHLNGAIYLSDLRHKLSLPASLNLLLEETEIELFEISLVYWEQLVDLNPNNIENLNTLFTLYSRLGMIEEAESLEQSYNF